MTRKKRTPEENVRREKIRELLQLANIGSMEDIQDLFKETIAEFMHIPDQQLHMHGILAPLRRSGAPLHERKERDLYNWCSTGNCDYINWRSDHAKLSGDFEAG